MRRGQFNFYDQRNTNQNLFLSSQNQNLTLSSYQISFNLSDYLLLNTLKNGNQSEIIISDIISSFTNCVKQQTSNKRNVVFIIGNTGAGKTTLAAFLSGINLVVEQNELNQSIINYQQNNQFQRKIGLNVLQSETSFPMSLRAALLTFILIAQDFKTLNKLKLISQTRFLFIIFNNGSLLECKGLSSERCQPYKQQIQYLISMTRDTTFDISKNLLIVISKTTKDNITFYQDKLRKVFQELSGNSKFIQQLNETKYFNASYQEFFRNLQKTKIITFPSPPKDKNYQIYITAKQIIEQSLNSMQGTLHVNWVVFGATYHKINKNKGSFLPNGKAALAGESQRFHKGFFVEALKYYMLQCQSNKNKQSNMVNNTTYSSIFMEGFSIPQVI
ncbi:hypothetical protein TTHERM_00257040 (macronuclear) [Tetrahymena thermophila SB210]|uniref:Uncharacterized protein n=1 Tax=Tetrahymena thermophila (strain SB210) TaxID=312017 RepID=Q23QH4_TETTS|nr:hypothetical protein TTHERM_00257040 [Tetrahymena thermophila SB210]EAR98914.1 hypothetical protein TTHERM_00257040 [Tetrahymena thermophila SB210]|eukprot:XP_001019159.1 hypothetical protein TTHERM_00257040 [Tetrahymena thermophila SB210]